MVGTFHTRNKSKDTKFKLLLAFKHQNRENLMKTQMTFLLIGAAVSGFQRLISVKIEIKYL